jgi:uncharacterized membrane protein (DUF373 family)
MSAPGGREPVRLSVGGRPMRALTLLERLALYLVAALFLLTGIGVLVAAVADLAHPRVSWEVRVGDLVEGLLLGVIIIEIYSSVLIAITRGRFAVEPFLVIGIVAAARHILAVGVHVALGPGTKVEAQNELLDLGVNAAVILALVVSLALVRWSNRWDSGD